MEDYPFVVCPKPYETSSQDDEYSSKGDLKLLNMPSQDTQYRQEAVGSGSSRPDVDPNSTKPSAGRTDLIDPKERYDENTQKDVYESELSAFSSAVKSGEVESSSEEESRVRETKENVPESGDTSESDPNLRYPSDVERKSTDGHPSVKRTSMDYQVGQDTFQRKHDYTSNVSRMVAEQDAEHESEQDAEQATDLSVNRMTTPDRSNFGEDADTDEMHSSSEGTKSESKKSTRQFMVLRSIDDSEPHILSMTVNDDSDDDDPLEIVTDETSFKQENPGSDWGSDSDTDISDGEWEKLTSTFSGDQTRQNEPEESKTEEEFGGVASETPSYDDQNLTDFVNEKLNKMFAGSELGQPPPDVEWSKYLYDIHPDESSSERYGNFDTSGLDMKHYMPDGVEFLPKKKKRKGSRYKKRRKRAKAPDILDSLNLMPSHAAAEKGHYRKRRKRVPKQSTKAPDFLDSLNLMPSEAMIQQQEQLLNSRRTRVRKPRQPRQPKVNHKANLQKIFNRSALAVVGPIEETGNTTVKCTICNTSCVDGEDLFNHMKRHEGTKTQYLKCNFCPKVFSNKSTLTMHERIHIGYRPFHCKVCNKGFFQRANIKVHMRAHTGEKPYKCNICGKAYPVKLSLAAHSASHKENKFACKQCKFCFETEEELEKHQQVHATQRIHSCPKCKKKFLKAYLLEFHLQRDCQEKKFICQWCGKEFQCQDYLKVHTRVHTGERPFGCEICGKFFSQSANLTKHLKIHNNIRDFHCDFCPMTFVEKASMISHRRTHTGEKPHMCDLCGMAFSSPSSLVIHHRVHTGEKPFQCEMCAKNFSSSGKLRDHLRTHTGEKPYHCKFCDKSFALSNGLVRHTRIHTGERPHQCSICGKKFMRKDRWRKHVSSHSETQTNFVNVNMNMNMNMNMSMSMYQ